MIHKTYLWCTGSDSCMWTTTGSQSKPRNLSFYKTENYDKNLQIAVTWHHCHTVTNISHYENSSQKRLQSVQDAATQKFCISGARCYDHSTLVLTTFHWLPVCKRVMFKTALLVWKCLKSTVPNYLSAFSLPLLYVGHHASLDRLIPSS